MTLGAKRGRRPKQSIPDEMDNEMDKKVEAGEGTKQESFPVILLRNYAKLSDGVKHFAGEGLSLPIEEAKKIMDLGIAKRNDPLF